MKGLLILQEVGLFCCCQRVRIGQISDGCTASLVPCGNLVSFSVRDMGRGPSQMQERTVRGGFQRAPRSESLVLVLVRMEQTNIDRLVVLTTRLTGLKF